MNLSEEDLLEIKDLIGKFFLTRPQKKVNEAVDRHGYTQEDFDAWLNDPNQ